MASPPPPQGLALSIAPKHHCHMDCCKDFRRLVRRSFFFELSVSPWCSVALQPSSVTLLPLSIVLRYHRFCLGMDYHCPSSFSSSGLRLRRTSAPQLRLRRSQNKGVSQTKTETLASPPQGVSHRRRPSKSGPSLFVPSGFSKNNPYWLSVLVLYRRRRLLTVVLRRSVLTVSDCSSFAQPRFCAVRRTARRLVSVSVSVVLLPLCSDCSERRSITKLNKKDRKRRREVRLCEIKQASMTLAKMYMKRVTMELESNWNTDRESSQDSLLLQGSFCIQSLSVCWRPRLGNTARFRRDKATHTGTPCSRISRTFGWHTNGNHHEKPLIFFYYALLDSWLSPPKAGILTFITIIFFVFLLIYLPPMVPKQKR
ncbi:hypothetical protein Ahy_B02g058327 [Arachis hypogaea]|uniref:Uncharacterized protein n=1 Tax=Arachis hypogaea TaxID=3818 RepID=A0A445AEC5_ARAHY|nr:hypothetical protein Ahy_B02g058327 [Arachis hypogaea]